MLHLQESLLEDKNQRMVRLAWHVQQVSGFEAAIILARKFRIFKTVTNLAYHSGDTELYEAIYEIVDSNEYQLVWAMRAVYDQDKQCIIEAVHKATDGHMTAFSPNYNGLKLIEIFEHKYFEPLKAFLSRYNQTLYGILLARSSISFDQACRNESLDSNAQIQANMQESENIIAHTVKNCQLLDTQESLACLGHSVSQFNKTE